MRTLHKINNIKIIMNYNDHNPPHIHIIYNENKCVIDLKNFKIKGKLPKKYSRKVRH